MRSPISPSRFLLLAAVAALLVVPAAGQVFVKVCSAPALPFGGANGTPAMTTHTLFVANGPVIGDVHVGIDITHTWVGDVHLELTSPAGTTVILQDGAGGDADDIHLVYADAGVAYGSAPFDFGCYMRPSGAGTGAVLSAFAGESANGVWTLSLLDDYPTSADGVLEEICLSIFATAQTTLPAPISGLAAAPTSDGANLTWTNGSAYSLIDVIIDGSMTASLPGSATSHLIAGMPAGQSFRVDVVGYLAAGGAPSCPVGETVWPLGALPTPRTEKLVFVLIDGLRYEDGLGHPTRANVPFMDALAQEGVIIEPFLNQGVTVTTRSVSALMCGSYQAPVSFFDSTCNANNLHAPRPTIFEYYRKQLGKPATDCQYVLGPYCPWRGSFHPAYGPAYWPQWVSTSGGDNANWAAAQVVLAVDKPTFLTLYLPDVDSQGHGGNFTNYINAIQNADSIVGSLWSYLQADPEYAGKTTMIITNDHGRHWYDFSGHGDNCSGCETIQLLAIGPGVRSGLTSNLQRTIPDFAPTIGALLGFATEFADGSVMSEILAQCQTDIGYGGPGLSSLSVCGGDLSAGTTATTYFTGGPINGNAVGVASLTLAPMPIVGGTIIDLTPDLVFDLPTNAAGAAVVPGLPGGVGPFSLFMQVLHFDPATVAPPPHIGFSNAVRIDFL